ncbi:dihydrofolate synthase [Actinomycetes bacterium]|nr:dihydrofolate synthase [Actinomycetes bacterium]
MNREMGSWLDSHVNLESLGLPPGTSRRQVAPTLERIEALLALLGSPHVEFPAIHITGTNGKTSTALLVSELLSEEGLSVGTYTSPHLESINERIRWNTTPISDAALDDLLQRIATVEEFLISPPSYFEILTAAAFTFFADIAVDVAVIEVGLGGRWDATNVVNAPVAVITNINVDHVEYLGPTRAEIAEEKSGIITAGKTLVLGETDPSLTEIFSRRKPKKIITRDQDFGVTSNLPALGGRLLNIFTPTTLYPEVFLSLHGSHQGDNASIALCATEEFFGRPVNEDVVAAVFGQARSPGRLEVVGHQPLVVLDGAHNVSGALALRSSLNEEFAAAPTILVIGLLGEKDPTEMLSALGVLDVKLLICCCPPSPRAMPASELAAAAVALGLDKSNISIVDDVLAAVKSAQDQAEATDQIIVTGSLYVVGEARGSFGDSH